jgi:hypothetical protein
MSIGQPVAALGYLSAKNAAQKARRRSSSSVQSSAGTNIGFKSESGLSRRCKPRIWANRTQRAELVPVLGKAMLCASYLEIKYQHITCDTVTLDSPLPCRSVNMLTLNLSRNPPSFHRYRHTSLLADRRHSEDGYTSRTPRCMGPDDIS